MGAGTPAFLWIVNFFTQRDFGFIFQGMMIFLSSKHRYRRIFPVSLRRLIRLAARWMDKKS